MDIEYETLHKWFVIYPLVVMVVMVVVSNLIVKKHYKVEKQWGWHKKYIYQGEGALVPIVFNASIVIATLCFVMVFAFSLFGKSIYLGLVS